MKKIFLAILVGFALTVLFYFVGAFLSGGGHDLSVITTFFPYSLSLGILTEGTSWARSGSAVAGALLVLQFPLYAVVFATSKQRQWKWPLIILVCVHVLAAVIGLCIYHASQSGYFNSVIQQAPGAGISVDSWLGWRYQVGRNPPGACSGLESGCLVVAKLNATSHCHNRVSHCALGIEFASRSSESTLAISPKNRSDRVRLELR